KTAFLESYLDDRRKTATTEMLFERVKAFEEVETRPPPEQVSWTGFSALVFKGPFVGLPNWAPLRTWPFAVEMERHLLARLEQEFRATADGQFGESVNRDAKSVLKAFDTL